MCVCGCPQVRNGGPEVHFRFGLRVCTARGLREETRNGSKNLNGTGGCWDQRQDASRGTDEYKHSFAIP